MTLLAPLGGAGLLRVFRYFAHFVGLSIRDVAADDDFVCGVAVLGDQDAVSAFPHGPRAGDLYGGVQVAFYGVRVVSCDFQDKVGMVLDDRGLRRVWFEGRMPRCRVAWEQGD